MHSVDAAGSIRQAPLVSVVVPVYNVQEQLPDCLNSIISQTYRNTEIICIDDGSTDKSPAILERFRLKDKRIKVYRQENLGLAGARNTGLKLVSGDYILFVDSDDTAHADLLQKTMDMAIQCDADLILFKYQAVEYGTGTVYPEPNCIQTDNLPPADTFSGKDVDDLFGIAYPNVWTKLFRRDLLLSDTPLMFPKLRYAEDLPFTYTALAMAKRIAVVDAPLYDYLLARPTSLTVVKQPGSNTIIDSVLALKSNLEERGLMEAFERSYHSRAVLNIHYELWRSKDPRELASLLTEDCLQTLGLASLSESDFTSRTAYLCYQDLLASIEITLASSHVLSLTDLAEICEETEPAAVASLLRRQYKDSPAALSQAILAEGNAFPSCRKHSIECVAMVYSRLRHGGTERVMAQLATHFTSLGKRVVLFTEEQASEADFPYPEGATRVIVPDIDDYNSYLERADVIAGTISSLGIDLVIHHRWNHPLTFWDSLAVRLAGAKFAIHCHNYFLCPAIWNLNDRVELMQQTYKAYDGIVALSRVDREYWRCFNKNVHFVHNPLPELAREDSGNTAPESPFSQEGPNIIWIGRLAAEKQYHDIIPIARAIAATCPNAVIHILGNADNEAESQAFAAQIAQAGLSDNIVLHGWQPDLSAYYANANIIIATSLFEGWSLNLYEASVFGLPAVSYDLPYLEAFREANGVVSVAQGDCDALAREVLAILADPSYCEELRKRALAFNARMMDYDYAKAWLQVLSSFATETPSMPGIGNGSSGTEAGVACEQDTESKSLMIECLMSTYKHTYIDPSEPAYAEAAKAAALSEMEASKSYRVGRAITKIPRMIAGR